MKSSNADIVSKSFSLFNKLLFWYKVSLGPLFVGTGSASFLWSEIIQRLPTEENSSGNPLDDKRKGFFFAACIMAVPIIIAVLIAASSISIV